jgi:uncharacterized protein YegP (UPF0339 family)
MHQYEISRGLNGTGFYWRLRCLNNRNIVADGSEPYSTKSNARRAVRRLQAKGFGAHAPIVNA